MAEADVERLSRLESVDTSRAEEALDMADGDFEGARSILKNAPVALKFRFSSQDEDVYGLGLFLMEVSPPALQELSVVVANDKSLGTIGLSESYPKLKRIISTRSNEPSAMAALSQRLREGMNDALSPPSEDWISLVKAQNVSELQLYLEELVKNVLNQDDLVLTADLEVGLIHGPEEPSEDSSGSESSGSRSRRRSDEVTLVCDLKVSPVKGEAIQDLRPGDVIFVDVNQVKNEHRKIVGVLDNFRDDETGLIPVPIESMSRTQTGKVEIIVQFGENVFGETVAGEDMNIFTPASVSGIDTSVGGLLSLLPWLLAGLILLIIGILLLYVWVFPV